MTSVRSINRSVTPRRAEFSLFCGLTGTGVADFGNGLDSSSWIELPRDRRPDRTAGPDDILEDAVDDILIEYAQVPVAQDVVLQGLELQAGILGNIADGDQPEIGQARLGAEGGELRNLDFDLVAGKVVGKCGQARQPGLQAGFGLVLSVGFPAIVFHARPGNFPSSIYYPLPEDKPMNGSCHDAFRVNTCFLHGPRLFLKLNRSPKRRRRWTSAARRRTSPAAIAPTNPAAARASAANAWPTTGATRNPPPACSPLRPRGPMTGRSASSSPYIKINVEKLE